MARKLEITNLRYAYDTIDAVDNISLHVDEGEFVGVIGPNGCGKSTTLKCV